eukprot:TRINITY_DN1618_c0_g1_i1.p1 TRINITY_DN1618_c0_g1~~TRINITY_DN1618_c0_g1_i1.p1  ORF type:complete len:239 (-),score=42.70 TRINITY_DN1618_c0_g1_i1:82-798(-)
MRALLLCVLVFSLTIANTYGVLVPTSIPASSPKPNAQFSCAVCVDATDEMIDVLLNIILNGGVIGSCTELCTQLPNKVEELVCGVACGYFGIKEFIKIIESTDPDPIWICEEINSCPVYQNGLANITSTNVTPSTGPAGSKFSISMTYTVTNHTSTGLFVLQIQPPEGMIFGDSVLTEGQAPGNYQLAFTLDTTPTEDEPFLPGVYKTLLAICAGDCTTKHPNGGVYTNATTTFTISK